jgi:hypothetical protein
MATEVSPEEFAHKLGDKAAVQEALKRSQGMAMFNDGRGNRLAITWGTRDADLPGPPPRMYGGGELEMFVSPQKSSASMVSPLKAAIDDQQRVPQIKAPPRSSTVTSYPDVLISGRSSAHPRGNSEYITPGRPAPPEPPPPPAPQEPASDDIAWWAKQLQSGTTRPR